MKTISLSKQLGVTREVLEKEGIYDSTLGIDTKLFIDPKLLVNSNIKEFKNSRKTIIQYFALLLKIHKQSYRSRRLLDKARDMLAIPEPQGLSIGYGNKTDRGTAISKSIANKILLSASEILSIGIDDEELVEILGLFVSGFGPDSISDLTVSIIYKDFCEYTERLSIKLKIHTITYIINHKEYNLPKHPFKNSPIIFVPNSLLCPLPVAVSWDDIVSAAQHNQALREDLNAIVLPVLQESIENIRNQSDSQIQKFRNDFNTLLNIYRKIEVRPYDLQIDNKGYYAIQPFAEQEYKNITATTAPKTKKELVLCIRELISQFQRSIECNGGNTLLYKKNKSGKLLKNERHREDVAQILFYLIADFYCQKTNIVLEREPNAGLGPVDFSLATSYSSKILVEIKKSTNKDLWSGYQKQITAYIKSEKAFYSFFVVIIVKENKKKNKETHSQLQQIKEVYEQNIRDNKPTPELIIIDGLVYPSPSKLR